MNNEIELLEIGDIRQIIQDKQLKTVILETGDKNIFIPEENKFIVTKYFLKNKANNFLDCILLQEIIMEDFDFSEITSLDFWFFGCRNLREIIFPIKANCQNVTSLYSCFSWMNMNTIDLSFMDFKGDKNLVNLDCAFCVTPAKKIVLPKCNVESISDCFCDSTNLEEIIAPITINSYNNDTFMKTFKNCPQLQLIDFSDSNMSQKELMKQLWNPINKNNLSEDCVIVLP